MILNIENFRQKITHSEPPTVKWIVAQEEYKFGDVTKKAMGKAMDAITSFTGKEDTFFGFEELQESWQKSKVAVFWEPIYTPCVYTGSISPPFEGPMILREF